MLRVCAGALPRPSRGGLGKTSRFSTKTAGPRCSVRDLPTYRHRAERLPRDFAQTRGTRLSSRCPNINAACIHPTTFRVLRRSESGRNATRTHSNSLQFTPTTSRGHGANDLDGWPSASSGLCAPYGHGFLHGPMGWRYPDGQHHASERKAGFAATVFPAATGPP